MTLSKKLKLALKSSPSTKPLIKYLEGLDTTVTSNDSILQNAVDNDTIYDDTEIQNKVGALETSVGDNNSGLVKDVNDLKTTVGDANTDNTLVKDVANLKTSKASANHTHTLSNISDLSTVNMEITYSDESTETILLVKQTQS